PSERAPRMKSWEFHCMALNGRFIVSSIRGPRRLSVPPDMRDVMGSYGADGQLSPASARSCEGRAGRRRMARYGTSIRRCRGRVCGDRPGRSFTVWWRGAPIVMMARRRGSVRELLVVDRVEEGLPGGR